MGWDIWWRDNNLTRFLVSLSIVRQIVGYRNHSHPQIAQIKSPDQKYKLDFRIT